MKWFCRISLIVISSGFTYVVTQPSYNFAHWVPHNLLREIGIRYEYVLWAESNADVALHFVGAALLTFLAYGASIKPLNSHRFIPLGVVWSLCIGAEIAQHLVGRGIETSDLLLGICGSFMAYLALHKNN